LRVLVYAFLHYSNPDQHYLIVEYIHRTGRIPLSRDFNQSFHPPLYHLLASPLLAFGSFKVVQLFSLLISVLTIGLGYTFIRRSPVFEHKALVFAFFCLLPEFVTFSLYISNDTLSFLVGVAVIVQVQRFIQAPDRRNELGLAAIVGIGLLTKGTFLILVPPVLALIAWVRHRRRQPAMRTAAAVGLALLIITGVGGYKFVQNTVYEGRPLIHRLDYNPTWAESQRPTYLGFAESVLDFNVLRLIRNPTLYEIAPDGNGARRQGQSTARHSYGLMLYATFYYSWIPESNFISWKTNLRYWGSAIYLFALVPTALMLVGAWRLRRYARAVLSGTDDGTGLFRIVAATFFVLNLAAVVHLGVKYDVWSCFQGRLLFPTLFGALVLLESGIQAVHSHAIYRRGVVVALVTLDLLFLSYLLMEVACIAWGSS